MQQTENERETSLDAELHLQAALYGVLFQTFADKVSFESRICLVAGYPLSTYAKFSEKPTFLPPCVTCTCAYQGVKSVSFSEKILRT